MAVEISAAEKRIREERAQTFDKMVALMEKMDRGEDVTVEDRTAFDQAEEHLEVLDGDLDRLKTLKQRDEGHREAAETRQVSEDQNEHDMREYENAYREWFKHGVTDANRKVVNRGYHIPTDLTMRDLRAELDNSSLQTVPGQGGYMIPQGFWQNLQIAMKAYGGVLPLMNVVKTASGNEMPWPTSNPTGVLGSYITEANQVGFTDYSFGQGILYAWTITSGVILASYQLINDSAFSVDSFVTDRMGEAIGRFVAQELWSGAGSGAKALTGINTAIVAAGGSGSGILSGSTGTQGNAGRYVQAPPGEKIPTLSNVSPSSGNGLAGQLVSWTSLTQLIAGVDPAYRTNNRCQFVMNDAQLQRERTLSDGFGHPLWEPNTQAGQPDVILGYPVVVDNSMPSVSASANTPGGVLFGDLKTAMVVRQVDMAGSMRLTERYADYLQVGYLGYVRMDAQPNDLRAVSYYESGAS